MGGQNCGARPREPKLGDRNWAAHRSWSWWSICLKQIKMKMVYIPPPEGQRNGQPSRCRPDIYVTGVTRIEESREGLKNSHRIPFISVSPRPSVTPTCPGLPRNRKKSKLLPPFAPLFRNDLLKHTVQRNQLFVMSQRVVTPLAVNR